MEMRWSIKKSLRVTVISAEGLVAVTPHLSSTVLKQGGKTKGIPKKKLNALKFRRKSLHNNHF